MEFDNWIVWSVKGFSLPLLWLKNEHAALERCLYVPILSMDWSRGPQPPSHDPLLWTVWNWAVEAVGECVRSVIPVSSRHACSSNCASCRCAYALLMQMELHAHVHARYSCRTISSPPFPLAHKARKVGDHWIKDLITLAIYVKIIDIDFIWTNIIKYGFHL